MGSQGFPMTIVGSRDPVPEQKLYDTTQQARKSADATAVRDVSAPFSAYRKFIIAPRPLSEFVPTQLVARRKNYYAVICTSRAWALNSIFGNQKPCYSPERVPTCQNSRHIHRYQNIPLDDKKHSQCSEGETMGLFQLNGSGARYLKELKPTTIHDVNAMVASTARAPWILSHSTSSESAAAPRINPTRG